MKTRNAEMKMVKKPVYFEARMWEELRQISEKTGAPINHYIRLAVEHFVSNAKRQLEHDARSLKAAAAKGGKP